MFDIMLIIAANLMIGALYKVKYFSMNQPLLVKQVGLKVENYYIQYPPT